MNKLYNTQHDFASSLNDFFKNSVPFIRKTQLNILPHIIWGMLLAESSVATDIAKHIKGPEFDNIQFDSKVKRIRRFYNNKLLILTLFMIISLDLLLLIIRKNIKIIVFILLLITCFLITIIPSL